MELVVPRRLRSRLAQAAALFLACTVAPAARAAELRGGELLLSCPGWDLTEIEPDTGEQKPLGVSTDSALAVDAQGIVWGVSAHRIVRIDPRTGDTRAPVALVNNFDTSDDGDLLPEPGGTLLHAHNGAVSRVDPASGQVTVLASGAPLVKPLGLAFAGDGDVFVADALAGAVFRLTPGGDVTPVASGDLLVGPTQVHVLPDGDLLVVRTGGRPVRVDPDSGAQSLYSPLVIGAIAAAVAPDGSLVVVTQAGTSGRLVRFTDPGQEPAELLRAGNRASGQPVGGLGKVDVAADGTIVVLGFAYEPGSSAQLRSILALPPAGGAAALRFVSADPPQGGIAAGKDGSLYVASTSGLRRVDPRTGAWQTVASGGEIARPIDAVVEDAGTVLVLNNADAGGARGIVRVDPETGAQTVLAEDGLFSLPRRLALGADGAAYVASGDEVVIRVDPVTGAQSVASSGGWLATTYDVAAEAGGTLLALELDLGVEQLVRIEPGSPTQTPVGASLRSTMPPYGPNQSSDIAITPDGTPWVLLLATAGSFSLFRAPLDAAQVELVSALPLCEGSELEAVLAPEPAAALAGWIAWIAVSTRARRRAGRRPGRG